MATVPTQIRIDRDIKVQATTLFASLGLDMSCAVNLFLRQCVLRGGIPFPIEMPKGGADELSTTRENCMFNNKNESIKIGDNVNR